MVDDRGRKLQIHALSEAKSLPKDTSTTVQMTVTELWGANSANVHQMGRIRDASQNGENSKPESKFIIWSGHNHT